ncbi:MAG: alpha/beta hydrolase [Chloroflexi bacterium]|nr:alpha/beta hydrolase [Chloroflexota bacterium]
MTTQVVFLQGAGKGAYDVDGILVASLRDSLGDNYEVFYPRMPDEDNPTYKLWKNRLATEFLALGDEVIVVGHSLGGSVALKYLSEGDVSNDILGMFLLAMPYWGAEDWEVDEYILQDDFAENLPDVPIFLYHCLDDDVVPFSHLRLYADRMPDVRLREFAEGGHQFNDDMSAVATDIAHL